MSSSSQVTKRDPGLGTEDEDQGLLRGLAVVTRKTRPMGPQPEQSESLLWEAGDSGPLQGREDPGELLGNDDRAGL